MMSLADRSTRHLTEARIELAPASRLAVRRSLAGVAVALIVVMGLMQFGGPGVPLSQVGRLEAENATLRTELSELRVELDIERATRTALDQQMAELNGQLGELASQVDFYRSKGAAGAAKRRPAGSEE